MVKAVPGFDAVGAGLQRLAGCRLDHLGIAVADLAQARLFYEELLGLRVDYVESITREQVRVAMLQTGESRIELLEPITEDSVIGRFIARRGEGLHHIALAVDCIDQHFERMRAAGVRLASDEIRVGAGGHRYFFVHPQSTGGVLLELVEAWHGTAAAAG